MSQLAATYAFLLGFGTRAQSVVSGRWLSIEPARITSQFCELSLRITCLHVFQIGDLELTMLSKEYLKTARTLLRVAQNMTDQTIADRLKALSEDYERRAEKASYVDVAKAFVRSPARST